MNMLRASYFTVRNFDIKQPTDKIFCSKFANNPTYRYKLCADHEHFNSLSVFRRAQRTAKMTVKVHDQTRLHSELVDEVHVVLSTDRRVRRLVSQLNVNMKLIKFILI
jgi:hypothetical protein